jgi:oxepin-CoA hydrolase/3-oxo-5,6-dehydrosuberyl-CoA semialdehyde dehydrogenase
MHGAAVHVNAFNFPAWGVFEKAAVALLAGVPVITKPATATSLISYRMMQIIVDAGILPSGALSMICGSTGDLLEHLGPQDALAFTGSASTGTYLRGLENMLARSVRVNVEADSLNAAVLGPDVELGDELWHLFVRNVVTDMRQKTGQKCTAIRRVLVPSGRVDELCEAVSEELARIVVGDPSTDGVTMGPVATAAQHADVRAGINRLAEQTSLVCGGSDPVQGQGAPEGKGFYIAPTLLRADDARAASEVHRHEVFGPCATVLPYDGTATEGASLVGLGQGCLVSSIYTDDRAWMKTMLEEASPWCGRLLAASTKVADQTLAPGMVLPTLVHGGPGRAGGGEELGGARGLEFYTQRTAIQGDSGLLGKLLGTRTKKGG